MLRLPDSLCAWGAPGFENILKQELVQHTDALPLQQGLTHSNHVTDAPVTVMIHSVAATDDAIRVKAGIFYQGALGGCSCADDPAPASENNEYCELELSIDKVSAATMVTLVTDDES